jgi:4-amino-4-deoxy-L-arabinose transferase-like glycosyltransferase
MGKRSRDKEKRRLERRASPSVAGVWDPASAELDRIPTRPLGELVREHRVPLLVIFAVALALRIAALILIARSPYREVANIDSEAYEKWASEILATGWLPSRGFYQSPLYAYWLALVHALLGPGTFATRIIQIVLGSASAAIVYGIGARLFTRRVGWIAGLGLAMYGPLILEEVTVSKTTLLVFTVVASFGLFLRHAPLAQLPGIAASGFLLGVSVVGVGQWLPGFLAFGVTSAYVPAAVDRKRRAIVAATFLGAGALAIGPIAAWNSWQAGGLVLTSGEAGLNLYMGNNERAGALPARPAGLRDLPQYEEEDSRRIAEREEGHALGPSEVSAYWTRRAVAFALGHPGAYLTLLGKKLAVLWDGYEIPDNYHYAFVRAYFVPLFYACLSFGAVAPFALVGMAFPFWRRRTVLAMAVLCFAYLATLLLFYVRSRYRIPVVPFLLVFAGVAVERGIGWIGARRWSALGTAVGGLLVASVLVNQRYCEPPAHGFPETCLGGDTWYDQEWMKLGAWYDARGDLDRAILYMRRATECSAPRGPGQTWYWLGSLEARKAEALAGGAPARQEATEHLVAAEQAFRRAAQLKYRLNATYFSLVSVLARLRQPERVAAATDEALAVGALDRGALMRIASAQATAGNCVAAETVLARADRDRGSYSREAEAILARCAPR